MKDTLMEIKNNLQGVDSRMDKAKNQSNDMEYKQTNKQKKPHKSEKQEEKRIQNRQG